MRKPHRKRGHHRPPPEPVIESRMPCEVYSRIVGYLRPIRNWNVGKRQEFSERQVYNVSQAYVGSEVV